IPCDEHIRTAEINKRLPVGVSIGKVVKKDGFSIERKVSRFLKERVQWTFRHRARGFGHPGKHTFMRDNGGGIPVNSLSSLRYRFVASGVIQIPGGVDNPPDRLC